MTAGALMSLYWAVLALLGALCALAFIQGMGRALPVLILGLAMFAAPDVSQAKAVSSPSAFGRFKQTVTGTGKTKVTSASDGTPLAAPADAVADTDGGSGVKVTGAGDIVNPSGNKVRVNVLARVGQSAVARAVVRGVVVGVATGGVGLAIPLLELLAELHMRRNPETGEIEKLTNAGACTVAPCFEYANNAWPGMANKWFSTKQAACDASAAFAGWTVRDIAGNSCNFQNASGQYQGGISLTERSTAPQTEQWEPVPMTELEQEIASKSGWPSSSNLAPAVKAAVDATGESLSPEVQQVTGPAQSPGPAPKVNEKVNPDGSKQVTTQTVVHNHTYNGDTINTTTVTTTVTNNINPQGQTTDTTVETETEEPELTPGPSFDVANTPELPKLYERKYPDGLVGVWNTRKAELSASPLLTLAAQLMPSVAPGGSCPVWNIDVSFGQVATGVGWDFGTYDVAPPCWIWDACAAVIVVSALLLARALVFGG